MKKQPEITALTKQKLIDAFWTLYEENRIDQIRVKEITYIANLHRGTFYEYFTDIYDLLAQEEAEILKQLKEGMTLRLQEKDEIDGLKNIAEFYLKNGRRMNILISSGGDSGFLKQFTKALYPLFRSVNSRTDTEESSIIYAFGINGLLMAFHEWYEHQDRMPIDDFLILLRSLIEKGIPSTIKNVR